MKKPHLKPLPISKLPSRTSASYRWSSRYFSSSSCCSLVRGARARLGIIAQSGIPCRTGPAARLQLTTLLLGSLLELVPCLEHLAAPQLAVPLEPELEAYAIDRAHVGGRGVPILHELPERSAEGDGLESRRGRRMDMRPPGGIGHPGFTESRRAVLR